VPCETLRTRFPPGSPDAWRISLLLAGFRGAVLLLQRLHRLGASHRNLNPESIVVDATGRFTLRDLGLAVVSFRPGEGPAGFQAPEQLFGARMPRPGPATDVYQLAAIAYHVITGRAPGRGTPPARHPALPEPVTDVITAALAASPADRPGTRELHAALQAPNTRPKQSSRQGNAS
jgi:serine/threonine protein kinase